MTTLTTGELIKILSIFPVSTKVYLSSDSEGNSYGTLDKRWSIEYSQEDKVLNLLPFADHLDYSEVMPVQAAQIEKELREEGVIKDE